MNSLTIRPTTPQDLEELSETYTRAYNQLNIGETWSPAYALHLFQWYFEHNADLSFVAETNGTIIGGIFSLLKPWYDGMHLAEFDVFVDPEGQQSGAGSQLVKTMIEYGVEHYSVVACDGETHIVKEHPLKWYESIGFEKDKVLVVISGRAQEILQKIQ